MASKRNARQSHNSKQGKQPLNESEGSLASWIRKHRNFSVVAAMLLFIGIVAILVKPSILGFVILPGEESVVYNGTINATNLSGMVTYNVTVTASVPWFYEAQTYRTF